MEEGRDISSLSKEFDRVLLLDLDSSESQKAASSLLETSISLPKSANFPFEEPTTLENIRSSRPSQTELPKLSLSPEQVEDRIHGAYVGRAIGSLLGQDVEDWTRAKMIGYLNDSGRFPLDGFFTFSNLPPQTIAKYELTEAWGEKVENSKSTRQNLGFVLSNLGLSKSSGEKPIHKSPMRESIGEFNRRDFWGLITPGDQELGAEFAFREADETLSKNGVYSAMWVAGMIAATFVTNDIPTIIRAGMEQIPESSRLADILDSILEWHELEIDYGTCVYRIHEMWHETDPLHHFHSLPNSALIAIALLLGEGDFAKSICFAVESCFATSINGATTGAILGVLLGAKALPTIWTSRISETFETGLSDPATLSYREAANLTLRMIG